MATAKGTEMDRIQGLDTGADDYLVKPFGVMEMISRIKAVLRRCKPDQKKDVLSVAEITLSEKEHLVTVSGEKVVLTFKEFEILKLFMQNPGILFSPKEIYKRIWKDDPYGAEGTVAVHIRHLREKIELCPAEPRYLKAIWGQGYKIEKSPK